MLSLLTLPFRLRYMESNSFCRELISCRSSWLCFQLMFAANCFSFGGGIFEIMRIAAHAETYHIMFAPHNPNDPVATAASMQVAAAAHNFAILEFWSGVLNRTDIFDLNLEITDGYFKVPTKTGLGIEIHEELLAGDAVFPRYTELSRIFLLYFTFW